MHCHYLLQLNIYAKYTSYLTVVRENTFARSVCAEELESIYYSNDNPSFVFVIVSSTIMMPLFALILIIFSIINVDKKLINSLTDSTNHGTMVALVITGMWITIGIVVCDILACNVARGNHEYSSDIKVRSINLQVAYGTLVCDIIFILPMLLCIVCYKGRKVQKNVSKFLSCIVSKNTYEKINDHCLIFPFMLITPILCVSSHIGYIMLAWLTEPSKCTTIAILYYSFLLFIFFSLRKAYKSQSKLDISLHKYKSCNGYIVHEDQSQGDAMEMHQQENQGDSNSAMAPEQQGQCQDSAIQLQSQENGEDTEQQASQVNCCCCVSCRYDGSGNEHIASNEKDINTQVFCLLLLYSVFIIGIAVIFTLIFLLLPLASEELVRYLFELFQLMVVLVTGLITYKFFLSASFTFESVLKKLIKEYAAKEDTDSNLKAIAKKHEVQKFSVTAGEFGAEITHAIVKKHVTNHEF